MKRQRESDPTVIDDIYQHGPGPFILWGEREVGKPLWDRMLQTKDGACIQSPTIVWKSTTVDGLKAFASLMWLFDEMKGNDTGICVIVPIRRLFVSVCVVQATRSQKQTRRHGL